MLRIAFYCKFKVCNEILETFFKLGVAAVKVASTEDLDKILSNQEENISFIFDINFHEEIRKLCVKHQKPYVMWSFDSGIRNSISETAETKLRENDFLFLFNYKDYEVCRKFHPASYYLPFSSEDKYIIPPKTTDFSYDILVIMSTYQPELRHCEKSFQEAIAVEKSELGRKTYELLKFMMEYTVDRHKYIIDKNMINEFLDETITSCGFNPFNEQKRDIFCDQFGQVLSAKQREICIRELCSTKHKIDIFGDEDWRKITDEYSNCAYHGTAPYEKLGCLYSSAKININLTQIQNLSSIPQRIMHLLAAGAFILTNYDDIVQETFKTGIHIETFRTFEELKDKTDYYLKNDEERMKIARQGHEEFLAKHKMSDKLKIIINQVIPTSLSD